jgi:hypothetical protein
MDSFYMIVLSIAIVVLILLLTFVGILMRKARGADIFPPVTNMCPDYWDASSTPGVCILPNTTSTANYNTGSLGVTSAGGSSMSKLTTKPAQVKNGAANELKYGYRESTSATDPSTFNMSDIKGWADAYPGYTLKCAHRKWAIDNGISWDGVSNFNGCTDPL